LIFIFCDDRDHEDRHHDHENDQAGCDCGEHLFFGLLLPVIRAHRRLDISAHVKVAFDLDDLGRFAPNVDQVIKPFLLVPNRIGEFLLVPMSAGRNLGARGRGVAL
jgi:hypothetical protein